MKTYNQFINEGIRDKMTPRSKEDILKELDKLDSNDKIDHIFFYDPNGEIFNEKDLEKIFRELSPIQKINHGFDKNKDWLITLGIDETIEQDLDPEKVLDASFRHKYMKGIKAILDNYKLYGKDTKFIVSCYIPDIKNKEDVKFLMSNPQILKFLNPEQKYVIEKYRLGMHQSEVRDYEQKIIDILETLEYVESKEDPNIMIGRYGDSSSNKKSGEEIVFHNNNSKNDKEGVYFNYDKSTHKLTYHLDRLAKLFNINDMKSIYDFSYGYQGMIIAGLISKFYNLPEPKSISSSRNDKYSFKEI
jgi:hypothetical protein